MTTATAVNVDMYFHLFWVLLCIAGALGTALIAIGRGVFVPRKVCRETQGACAARVCSKIGTIQEAVEAHVDFSIKRDLWLAESVAQIGAALDVDLEPMPK